MTYTVTISDSADSDLEAIFLYIADNNIDTAIAFIDELTHNFLGRLSTFPLTGYLVNDKKNIRKISHKKYTAFYRVSEELQHVEILHILNLRKTLEARGIEF